MLLNYNKTYPYSERLFVSRFLKGLTGLNKDFNLILLSLKLLIGSKLIFS